MTFFKKKTLGQNFLRSVPALNKIADSADLQQNDVVLEIGPGEGTLTKILIERSRLVVAVEKDDRLIPILRQKFSAEISAGKFDLIHGDILNFDPSAHPSLSPRYKIVANIPYYITGEILRKFLSEWPQPESAVILMQKEVAERIVARDGKESLLSVSVKIYSSPKITGIIPAGSFSPPPNVDSAILQLKNISKKQLIDIDESYFFKILKAGFAHKRKFLSSNLKERELDMDFKIKTCGLSPKVRAEDLKVIDWVCLSGKSTD